MQLLHLRLEEDVLALEEAAVHLLVALLRHPLHREDLVLHPLLLHLPDFAPEVLAALEEAVAAHSHSDLQVVVEQGVVVVEEEFEHQQLVLEQEHQVAEPEQAVVDRRQQGEQQSQVVAVATAFAAFAAATPAFELVVVA